MMPEVMGALAWMLLIVAPVSIEVFFLAPVLSVWCAPFYAALVAILVIGLCGDWKPRFYLASLYFAVTWAGWFIPVDQ
jgi:hypothetical protein